MSLTSLRTSENALTDRQRIVWIDALKGFVILLVVLAHVAERFWKFDLYQDVYFLTKGIYDFIYSFHMYLFFGISGFFYRKAYLLPSFRERASKFKTQLLNLLIVYVYFSLITGTVKVIFSGGLLHPVDYTDIALFWLIPIGHMWYLYVLLLYYVIFLFVEKLLKTKNVKIEGFLTVLFLLCFYIGSVSGVSYFEMSRVMRYALFFYVGIMWDCRKKVFSDKVLTALSIMGIMVEPLYWHSGFIELSKYVTSIPKLFMAFGISALLIVVFKGFVALSNRPLIWLGRHTLEIYLLHQFPVTLMQKIILKLVIANGYVAFIIALLCSICSVLVVIRILEILKLQRLFFKPYSYFRERKIG